MWAIIVARTNYRHSQREPTNGGISSLIRILKARRNRRLNIICLPTTRQLVKTRRRRKNNKRTRIRRVRLSRIQVQKNRPLTTRQGNQLVTRSRRSPNLILNINRLIRRNLRTTIMRNLTMFSLKVITRRLRRSLRHLPNTSHTKTHSTIKRRFRTSRPLNSSLHLLLTLINCLTIVITLIIRQFHLHIPRSRRRIKVILHLFLSLTRVRTRSSKPFHAASLPPL